MSYFVTGATGFIGRYLVEELLDHREGEVFVLVRESSLPRMERMITRWGTSRVVPVVGDLGQDRLGLDADWIAEHAGKVEHFFHLAAIYDMTADDATNEAMNVGGTRHALELADALQVGCFHQVSSVAAAGEFHGRFDESMFAEGQDLPSPYHRTKYESEKIVREEATVPWRVYRPAVVVGDSQTGVMDKIDGPYYFFPMMKLLRDRLPAWLPLVGVDLGDTNVVPVDYVAKAMDHIAHLPRARRRGLPPRQPRAAAGRRPDQRVLRRRRRPDLRHPGRPQRHPRRTARADPPPAPPGRARDGVRQDRPGQAAARPDDRPARHPAGGARPHPVHRHLRLPAHRAGARPGRASASPTSSPTRAPCGATGRSTSTARPPATAVPAKRSPGSTS